MESKLQFAQALVRQAGSYIRQHMSDDLAIETKSRYDDLVTNLDKDTQNFVVEAIQTAYPDDFLMGEENNLRHPIKDGNVWVIDPIDGTVNFIVQKEDFAIMLAYFEDGVGQFGLIYDVMQDKLYSGGPDLPLMMNDQTLEAFDNRPLTRSLIGSNGSMYAHNVSGISNLINQTLGVRVYGGAGISMAHVLSGRLLAYFSHLYPWDYAAAQIIGSQLGYELLTLDGEQVDYQSRQMVMFIPSAYKQTIQDYMERGK
ncbi:inositol monophosphatase family protein [Streptococcus loxodontisalivarius]|uniref:Myo-inositol-1(Or 4)-monophosphatase n=1 Tax=Streptococcus loxodontisalivarius TaxID=1349415 RepID=A0ABS2PPP2_9STRE|nr:inositol monophosphatase family protein [Streptococcus loxodontisalivarius]MBM7641841.1 myo-inositol-1(or 4)-monophosphatase [Streptococcus loxodontisalivarius]